MTTVRIHGSSASRRARNDIERRINCPRKIYDLDNDFLDNKQVAGSYLHVLRAASRVGCLVDFRIHRYAAFGSYADQDQVARR